MYEPGGTMKIILLALAIWLLVCFVMVVFARRFTKFVGRKHRPRSDGPSPVAIRVYRHLDRGTTKSETPRGNNILSLPHKEVRVMSGLQLLTEKYVTRLKELEAQVEDVKHKLEIVMEASRLLEAEGLSEDGHPSFNYDKTFK